MSIEQDLNRIANSLESIAQRYAGEAPAAPAISPDLPPASLEPAVVTEPVLTPAQKGAATKAANKLKAQQEAAATPTEVSSVVPTAVVPPTTPPILEVVPGGPTPAQPPGTGTVHPTMVGTLDALNERIEENPALVMPSIPGTLEEMTNYAKTVAAYLGPRVNEIAELLAGKYQVSRLPEMQAVHYAQFTQDLHALATKDVQGGAA